MLLLCKCTPIVLGFNSDLWRSTNHMKGTNNFWVVVATSMITQIVRIGIHLKMVTGVFSPNFHFLYSYSVSFYIINGNNAKISKILLIFLFRFINLLLCVLNWLFKYISSHLFWGIILSLRWHIISFFVLLYPTKHANNLSNCYSVFLLTRLH